MFALEMVTTDRKMLDQSDAEESLSDPKKADAIAAPASERHGRNRSRFSYRMSTTAVPIRPVPWTDSSELPLNAVHPNGRSLQTGFVAVHVDEEGAPLQGREV
jgi:hypothetical protein